MRYGEVDVIGKLGDGVDKAGVAEVIRNAIEISMENGGNVLDTGIVTDVRIPYNCVIEQVTLLADQTGYIKIDLWKDTYANFPPTVVDTIVASAKPKICNGTKSVDSTLTGWTTIIAAGDVIRVNIDSILYITKCLLSLKLRKT